jgi:hypothetical protein
MQDLLPEAKKYGVLPLDNSTLTRWNAESVTERKSLNKAHLVICFDFRHATAVAFPVFSAWENSSAASTHRLVGSGNRLVGGSNRTFTNAGAMSRSAGFARPAGFARANAAFGNRFITNKALTSSFVRAPVFQGRFHGSHWP